MKFPYIIQRSINKYINKQIRKHRCRQASNLVLKLSKRGDLSDSDTYKYNEALWEIFSERERMYGDFQDWENYHKFHNLSMQKFEEVVDYKTKIWEVAFSN